MALARFRVPAIHPVTPLSFPKGLPLTAARSTGLSYRGPFGRSYGIDAAAGYRVWLVRALASSIHCAPTTLTTTASQTTAEESPHSRASRLAGITAAALTAVIARSLRSYAVVATA